MDEEEQYTQVGSPNERSKTSARSSLGIFGRALILLLRSADLASNV